MRQTHIDRKSRGQQRIKHKEIDSHIKTRFPNHAVICKVCCNIVSLQTCRKSYKWLKTCETHQSKTGCCKTIALGAATLSQRPDMAAGLRIHTEPSNRTGSGTIAADLHDIAPMQVDGAVEGDVAAGGANAAVAATGSAANMGETVCWVKEHTTSKCCSKCGKEMQQAVLHKQLPPTEDELKAWARSKQDRQIKRKAHSLVKLARKHIQPDNQQVVRLSILPRPLQITQEEAGMAIKFARSEATSKVAARLEAALTAALQAAAQGGANAARQQTNRKRQSSGVNNHKLSWLPPVSVKPQLKGADRMVARNYDAKNLLMPWGLRHCGHCDTIWCRDKNACINVHWRAMFYLQEPLNDKDGNPVVREDGPLYLRHREHSQA
ncbi:hypothetical protein HK105_201240 [Polyrhizophydium stewartii]|uniref:Uncharacterized protein n=1 Tax=Polyrhizophydium stewartii TaxID=2732419 RepID=A0ABR4NHG5_9FUNG